MWRRRVRKALGLSLVVFSASLFGAGCGARGGFLQRAIQGILSLSQGLGGGGFGGGGFGGGGPGGGFTPGGATEPEPGLDPFALGNNTPAPAPPLVNQPQAPLPATAAEALAEIRNKYGVRVAGSYRAEDVMRCLVSVRQFRPREVSGATVVYHPGAFRGGTAGYYQGGGSTCRIDIYDKDDVSTTMHELVHHLCLTGKNQYTVRLSRQIVQRWLPNGNPRMANRALIPTGYSMTNYDEWCAEFFSLDRMRQKGLVTRYTKGIYRSFNPPAQLRAQAAGMYAD